MKKKSFQMLGALMLATLFSASCTYDYSDAEEAEDQLIAITQYDQNANFKNYQTYVMPDTVYVLKSSGSGTMIIREPKTGATAQQILDKIASNMGSYGYEKVETGGDLVLNVTAWETDYTTIYAGGWWDYYYDWWYWGYWGYGPYYPYYPYPYYPYSVVTTYSAGTVMIDMVDMLNADQQTNRAPIVWTAFVRGLVTGDHTVAEVGQAIDECFAQSPYLNVK